MTLDRATFERVRDDLLEKRAAIDRTVEALNFLLADDVLMSPRIDVPALAQSKPHTIHVTPIPKQIPATAAAVTAPKQIAAPKGGPRLAHLKKPDRQIEKQAKALFMAGGVLKEIAVKIGWPEHSVYYWSHRDKWREERDAKSRQPVEGDETVERLRARRKSADDQIIQEVKAQVDARDWSGLSGGAFSRGGAGAFE